MFRSHQRQAAAGVCRRGSCAAACVATRHPHCLAGSTARARGPFQPVPRFPPYMWDQFGPIPVPCISTSWLRATGRNLLGISKNLACPHPGMVPCQKLADRYCRFASNLLFQGESSGSDEGHCTESSSGGCRTTSGGHSRGRNIGDSRGLNTAIGVDVRGLQVGEHSCHR